VDAYGGKRKVLRTTVGKGYPILASIHCTWLCNAIEKHEPKMSHWLCASILGRSEDTCNSIRKNGESTCIHLKRKQTKILQVTTWGQLDPKLLGQNFLRWPQKRKVDVLSLYFFIWLSLPWIKYMVSLQNLKLPINNRSPHIVLDIAASLCTRV